MARMRMGKSFYPTFISNTIKCHFIHNLLYYLVNECGWWFLPAAKFRQRIKSYEWASITCEIFYVYFCMLLEIKTLIVYDDWLEYELWGQIIKCTDWHDLKYACFPFFLRLKYVIEVFIAFCSRQQNSLQRNRKKPSRRVLPALISMAQNITSFISNCRFYENCVFFYPTK